MDEGSEEGPLVVVIESDYPIIFSSPLAESLSLCLWWCFSSVSCLRLLSFLRASLFFLLHLSSLQKYVYIGSRSEVLQLPLANCSRYQSQPDCLLARDPYCAWDSEGRACVRIDLHRG